MESSRNPPGCPPIHTQARADVPDCRLTGRIQQFPQRRLCTTGDQHRVRIRPCGILEEFVWSPRGFLELSTVSCTRVNNWVNPVEQLEERSRMNLEQPVNLHRRLVFILETPRGHPHGTTPADQWIRPQSTESTAPTTTSVLLIRDLSSKQGVWKVGRATRLRCHDVSGMENRAGRCPCTRSGRLITIRPMHERRIRPRTTRLLLLDPHRGAHPAPTTRTAGGSG